MSHETFVIDGIAISAASYSQAKASHRQLVAKQFPEEPTKRNEYIRGVLKHAKIIKVNGVTNIIQNGWVSWVNTIDWSTAVCTAPHTYDVTYGNVRYVVTFYALSPIG